MIDAPPEQHQWVKESNQDTYLDGFYERRLYVRIETEVWRRGVSVTGHRCLRGRKGCAMRCNGVYVTWLRYWPIKLLVLSQGTLLHAEMVAPRHRRVIFISQGPMNSCRTWRRRGVFTILQLLVPCKCCSLAGCSSPMSTRYLLRRSPLLVYWRRKTRQGMASYLLEACDESFGHLSNIFSKELHMKLVCWNDDDQIIFPSHYSSRKSLRGSLCCLTL